MSFGPKYTSRYIERAPVPPKIPQAIIIGSLQTHSFSLWIRSCFMDSFHKNEKHSSLFFSFIYNRKFDNFIFLLFFLFVLLLLIVFLL